MHSQMHFYIAALRYLKGQIYKVMNLKSAFSAGLGLSRHDYMRIPVLL